MRLSYHCQCNCICKHLLTNNITKKMDKLALFAEHQMNANQAMRDYIQTKHGEIDRLEQFENHYCSVRDKYLQFKDLLLKSDKTYSELQKRLDNELLTHKQTIDKLRIHNDNLMKYNQEQTLENKKLEHQLNDCVERLRRASQNHDYLNSSSLSSNNSFSINGNGTSGVTYMNATSTPQPNSLMPQVGNNMSPHITNTNSIVHRLCNDRL